MFFRPASRDEVAAWFRGLLEDAAVRIWIAEEGVTPVGYASVFLHEREENLFAHARRWFEIDQIGVRPDHQRRGIGRSLVRHVLEAAEGEGVPDVEFTCWCFNGGAQEAFRRLGFVPKAVRFGRELEGS